MQCGLPLTAFYSIRLVEIPKPYALLNRMICWGEWKHRCHRGERWCSLRGRRIGTPL